MRSSRTSNSIAQELENIKIDVHWDEETVIEFYKKKTREICARLEKEEKLKKKELLLNNNNNYFIAKNIRMFKLKRPNSAIKSTNSNFRTQLGNKPELINKNRITSAQISYNKRIEEPESVLNMLFPYVNENEFRIEPYKSGADIRKEYMERRHNTPVVKVNLEKRIKSNFLKKYKKYDKFLDTYAKNPSIRCSSLYITDEERRRQEYIKSKKLWVTTDDFRRFFGKKENEKNKEINKNEKYIPNKYVEPYLANVYRITDKNKWMSKKNFVV